MSAHRTRVWVSMKESGHGVSGARATFRLGGGKVVKAGRTGRSGSAQAVVAAGTRRGAATLRYRGRRYTIALGATSSVSGDPVLILIPGPVFPAGVENVSGAGFVANEPIAIYFDATPLVETVASGTSLAATAVAVPADAVSAPHTLTAVGHTGDGGTAALQVYTEWDGARGDSTESLADNVGSIGTRDAVNELNMSADRMAGGRWTKVFTQDIHATGLCTGDVMWTQSAQGVISCGGPDTQFGDPFGGLGVPLTPSSSPCVGGYDMSTPLEYNGITLADYAGGFAAYNTSSCAFVSGFPVSAGSGASSPTVMDDPSAGEDAVFGGRDGKLHALCFFLCTGATVSGAEPSGFPVSVGTGSQINGAPLVIGHGTSAAMYVAPVGGNLYAYNNSGSTLSGFTTVTTGFIMSSPIFDAGRIFFGSFDHKLYCVNPTTGAVVWTATTGGPIPSTPAIANGVVYVTSEDGHLYAFDELTGTQRWSSLLPMSSSGSLIPWSSPAVADGVVYVGGDNGGLYAYYTSTGQLVPGFPKLTGGTMQYTSPSIAMDTVTIATDQGSVWQLTPAPH